MPKYVKKIFSKIYTSYKSKTLVMNIRTINKTFILLINTIFLVYSKFSKISISRYNYYK